MAKIIFAVLAGALVATGCASGRAMLGSGTPASTDCMAEYTAHAALDSAGAVHSTVCAPALR